MEIKNIGVKIRNLRLIKQWSQEELARAAEIPLTTIAKIETGVIKNPSIGKIAKIAAALDISIDALINSKND